jgi:hypothetical protein
MLMPSSPPAADALDAASVRLGWGPQPVIPFEFDGTRAWAAVDVDLLEHGRRSAAGIASALTSSLLEALWNLPAHIEVRWDTLPARTATVLGAAPPGVIADHGETVERRWRPVARVVGVLVPAGRRWRRALDQAGRLAAPRVVVVAGRPTDRLVLEANWFDIGVIAGPRDAPEVVVPPRPFRGVPCPYLWEFAESVYGAWVAASAVMPSSTMPRSVVTASSPVP